MAARALSTWSEKLVAKLSDKSYRVAYVQQHVKTWIAYQIRALRDQRGWLQGKLADEMGKPQSVISRIEDPDYGKLTLQTLFDVAAAFDVALLVKFVDHKTFLTQGRNVSPADMRVTSFNATALMPTSARERSLRFVVRDLFDDQASAPSRPAQPVPQPTRVRQFTDSYLGIISIPSEHVEPEEAQSMQPRGFPLPPPKNTPVTEYSIG